MSLRFEHALDVARDADDGTRIHVSVTVTLSNGTINCFSGALYYSNKKQEEFISEETLSTSTGQPLQYCSSFFTVKLQSQDDEQFKNDASNKIDFSISNNLIESRIGLLRFSNEENKLHVVKFEEKGSFLIGREELTGMDKRENLYTIVFAEVITNPANSFLNE